MKAMVTTWICLSLLWCGSCSKELVEYEQGALKITVEPGEAWLHDFNLFMGITRKNAPQIAVWTEDMQGNYLSTVYVSHKIATQSWTAAGSNRRKEALPHWCHRRGIRYADGLYLPTKKEPLADGISGATPRSGFEVKVIPAQEMQQFVVKVEVNHSTDFNEHYPEDAAEGAANYSGGKMGSGQPAVVYAATVDLSSGEKNFSAVPIGHSSPDGSDGELTGDLSTLDSGLQIVKSITISLQ